MRKLRWVFVIVGGLPLVAGGMGIAAAAPSPQVMTAQHFDISRPLRDMSWNLPPVMQRMLAGKKATSAQIERLREKLIEAGVLPAPGSVREIPLYRKKPARSTPLQILDPDVQRTIPRTGSLAPNAFTSPSIGFDGLGASTGYSPVIDPPDSNASVGMNYVIEMVNFSFAVFKKSDGTMVLGPVSTNTPWSGFGGACENKNNGDVIVMYDQLAQRWVISMFALSGPYYQCIAVSTTDDPTGSWYRYAFKISNSNINDYPKLGVWPNAYYYTANLFNPSNGDFKGVAFAAFDRTQLIDGDPNAQMVLFNVPAGNGQLAFSVLPATLDGFTLPPAGAPGIFLDYVSPNRWSISYWALQMWRMHVDWQTPVNSTLSGPIRITVPAFNDGLCSLSNNCISQPNGAPGLEALSDRLMYRLAYRNLGFKQAMVVDQTVGVNTTNPPAGMRWYQLTAPTNSNTWSLAQAGTFAPGVTTSGGPSRWMGSVAMDHQGDIALGYSLSSSTIAPSIAYTGRVTGDPVGQMTEPETILKAGGGEQLGTANSWGDYTSMAVDPVDSCTFWYTNEYYATSSQAGWSTHIGAFGFPGCTPVILGTLAGAVSLASTGQPVKNATVVVEPGDIVAQTNTSGKYSIQLPGGGYTVKALKYPDLASAISISVSTGQTTTQDLSLQSAPLVTLSGKVIDAGLGNGAVAAHGWPLYAGITITTPYVGKVAEVFTNPVTGVYSAQLAQDFPFKLHVVTHNGYQPAAATLAPLVKDATKDFALVIDAACDVPGYGVPSFISENFNAGVPPSGWTITNGITGSPVVWNTNAYWQAGNYTGGTGFAAVADSYQANSLLGYSGPYDTSLITPKIPVSSLGVTPVLKFLLNYHEDALTGALDVGINVDSTGWVLLAHITTAQGKLYGLPGASEQIDIEPHISSGAKEIQIRWHYYDLPSGHDWYAQVDDFTIGSCRALPGGLIVGQVTDANTGNSVVAVVYDDLNESTATFPTPDDPNLKNLYILFASSGQRTLTAAGNNGLFSSATIPVSDSTVTQHNFPLGKKTPAPVPALGSGGGSLGLWSLALLFGLAGVIVATKIRRRRRF